MLCPPQPQLRAAFGEAFIGEEDFQAKDSRSGWGSSVPWSREGGGYWRWGNGKEEELAEKKTIKFGDRVWISILSSLVNLSPTNLRSGLSQFSGFLYTVFVTLKGIDQGHFSRPLPLSSQGDESQMSGHADETVGEQQAGRADGSFASRHHEHNQIFKWDPS